MRWKALVKDWSPLVMAQLPSELGQLEWRQPWNWIAQIYADDPKIHFELGYFHRMGAVELGLHFESKDKALNQHLLRGFQRHLVEMKAELGEGFEAEPWDKGWAKVYELVWVDGSGKFSAETQQSLADRMAVNICFLQPLLVDLTKSYRKEERLARRRR